MDVGLEHLGGAALQIEGEITLAVAPQPMGQPVRLDGVEALEIQERLDEALAGRVAFVDGGDVGAHRGRRCPASAAMRTEEGLHDQRREITSFFRRDATRWITAASKLGWLMIEVEEQRRELRGACVGFLGLPPQPRPQLVGELLQVPGIAGDQRQVAEMSVVTCEGLPTRVGFGSSSGIRAGVAQTGSAAPRRPGHQYRHGCCTVPARRAPRIPPRAAAGSAGRSDAPRARQCRPVQCAADFLGVEPVDHERNHPGFFRRGAEQAQPGNWPAAGAVACSSSSCSCAAIASRPILLDIVQCRAQADGIGDIAGAGLEARWRPVVLGVLEGHVGDHVAAALPGRRFLQHVAAAVHGADAGRAEHLVAGEHEPVAAERLHVRCACAETDCAPSSSTRAPYRCAMSIIWCDGVIVPRALETWVKATSFVRRPEQLAVFVEQHLAVVVDRGDAQLRAGFARTASARARCWRGVPAR